jgi:hypothetical protein
MARNLALQVIRGLAADIPVLVDGEFYLATDTGQLYVGLGGINFQIGVPGMATVQVQGNANPTHYIEPRADGTVNTLPGAWSGVNTVLKTAQLTTTAVTANQQILTYTVTTGFTLYLTYVDIQARLTTISATASILGTVIVQVNGVTVWTGTFTNPTTSQVDHKVVPLALPVPVLGTNIVTVLVTPNAATSMLWTANIGGFEK